MILMMPYSCKQLQSQKKDSYDIQIDFRLGYKYFSMYLNKDGNGYIIKGKGSYYTEPLQIQSSDTSRMFKIDSINKFIQNLDQIKSHPLISNMLGDGVPRTEIYYEQKRIYDAYNLDESFWSLFRPIIEQLPKGYNPFRISDDPWSNS